MGKLPVCSGQEAVKAFQALGWRQVRQTGSHLILVKDGVNVTLAVPNHKVLDRGTLRSLIRMAGITVDEFLKS